MIKIIQLLRLQTIHIPVSLTTLSPPRQSSIQLNLPSNGTIPSTLKATTRSVVKLSEFSLTRLPLPTREMAFFVAPLPYLLFLLLLLLILETQISCRFNPHPGLPYSRDVFGTDGFRVWKVTMGKIVIRTRDLIVERMTR